MKLISAARRALGLFNPKKFPTRARFARKLLAQRFRQRAFETASGLEAELSKAGFTSDEWCTRRRANSRLHVAAGVQFARSYATQNPDTAAECIADANAILEHRFNLLGSGSYRPQAPDRTPWPNGYVPIDWVLDPVRCLRFPEGFVYSQWDLYRDRPGNADVKYPWELARCQHLLTLAQAWVISGDSRYAQEILDQIRDFHEANPVGRGVNWTCTMDVALRAANWAIALDIIGPCANVSSADVMAAYGALFDQGGFIRANLENIYEVTSNHYLSNVVGLHFVAAALGDVAPARDWMAFASQAVQKEIDVQVLPDGADFESSIPYHRLVTELFLGSFRLAQHLEQPFTAHFKNRLEGMVEYLAGVLLPSGEMPILGDADDGRLMIATSYGTWNRKDPRHLLAPAALALNRPAWLDIAPRGSGWEAIWWGFDPARATALEHSPADNVRLYPDAGLAISRRRGHGRYLMVSNSIVGTRGFGNHKNNEQLSFEYHDEFQPIVVDPGSYVYTSDFDARNLFRSTSYHSTIEIDRVEQNEFNPQWLFRMFEKAEPQHVLFEERDGVVTYEGFHRGYETQLEHPVRHTRRFDHSLVSGRLEIADELSGSGTHDLRWSFHLHPSVTPEPGARGAVQLETSHGRWTLTYDPKLAVSIDDTWFSPSYGVRVPSHAIRLVCERTEIATNRWTFTLVRTA